MVIDTSALVAIIRGEAERDSMIDAIEAAPVQPLLPATCYLEAVMVIVGTLQASEASKIDEAIEALGIEIAPLDAQQVMAARQAFLTYGRSRHEARLNFGDCFAYALAKVHNLPLLFKGDNFSRTDITRVRYSAADQK